MQTAQNLSRFTLTNTWFLFLLVAPAFADPIDWRSEGRFNAATDPRPTAFNTFPDESIGGVALVDVSFVHDLTVLDGGVLQLNNGMFTITAASDDVLNGTYTDFRYTPVEGDPGMFIGAGDYDFNGGTGVFVEALGGGSWVAVAGFDDGSESMGFVNHVWTGQLINLVPEPNSSLLLVLGAFAIRRRHRIAL